MADNGYNSAYDSRGYEPSAPPLPESPPSSPSSSPFHDSLDHGHFPHRPPRAPPFPRHPKHDETLGQYLLGCVQEATSGLWRTSRTVLRIDMRRSLSFNGPAQNNRTGAGGDGNAPGKNRVEDEQPQGWIRGVQGGGARVKLMQVWDVTPDAGGESRLPWNISFGFGVNLEVDRGILQPKLRLKAKHVALHLFPFPSVELLGKWPIGDSNLAVNVKYRVPLTTSLEDLWHSDAQLMINLFNPLGTGFHLTPGGLEFDEHLVQLGAHTNLRVAAALDFPRKFPLEEGEQPLKVRLNRLGLKTTIL